MVNKGCDRFLQFSKSVQRRVSSCRGLSGGKGRDDAAAGSGAGPARPRSAAVRSDRRRRDPRAVSPRGSWLYMANRREEVMRDFGVNSLLSGRNKLMSKSSN